MSRFGDLRKGVAKTPAIIQVIITTRFGSIPDNKAKSSLSE